MQIRVFEDGEQIASGETGGQRQDLDDLSGFSVSVHSTDLASKLIDGRVKVEASRGDQRLNLTLFGGLRGWILTHLFVEHIPQLDSSQLRAVLENIQAHLVGGDRDYGVSRILDGSPAGEMTQAILPVGLMSLDQEAVIGRAGQVFLVRGTNQLLEQYQTPLDDPKAVAAANAWTDVFRERSARLQSAEVRYIQCIIPEKSSVLSDLFPVAIGSGTAIMRRLRLALKNDHDLAASCHDFLPALSAHECRRDAYQRIDTHLAPTGARVIASEIGRLLNGVTFDDVPLDTVMALGGDVGRRLLSPYARATMASPSGGVMDCLGAGLKKVEHHRTDFMTGTRVVYRNRTALLSDTCVVAFANSFFDVGDNPTHVSWWLARLFSEFHFVWSPEMNMDYVKHVKPKVVICQTIERFLSRPVST
ncbi:alginate O-acetyltransferase AlgX-related protein [Lichenihabitans psoromatis]|uniref:alginate O-acetyltransferase AlgX-related protein n=1 Tax=Lichenihabitans psoromatis TaxID=2528642 RepID=UPI001038544D|nr:hypothetical protein [Lichenihabitans psoromatis]